MVVITKCENLKIIGKNMCNFEELYLLNEIRFLKFVVMSSDFNENEILDRYDAPKLTKIQKRENRCHYQNMTS